MDIGLIRRFACGYVGGVKSIAAGAEVYQNMTGTTPAAWNDPAKGAELTRPRSTVVLMLSITLPVVPVPA